MRGGVGREGALAATINACQPDLVILQEASRPSVVQALAQACGLSHWAASPGHSLAYMSRVPIASHVWRRVRWARRAYLEVVTADGLRVYGVHLSAVHSNVTERRRAYELRALLSSIERHQHGFHFVTGDFNTLAPGERLDMTRLPPRIRAFAWVTGKTIRWVTIRLMLEAGYADGYRLLHPDGEGATFPSWSPDVRLDYAFLPTPYAATLQACDVARGLPGSNNASDHLPLLSSVVLSTIDRPAAGTSAETTAQRDSSHAIRQGQSAAPS
jgi:endonuclease/exonuclease/phosphatase family metal-dependent hydrolase